MEELYNQFAGIIFVLSVLIAALWFAQKRGIARFNLKANASERLIRILDRASLTPQHTLLVVEVDGKTFLLSASSASCQFIAELGRGAGQ